MFKGVLNFRFILTETTTMLKTALIWNKLEDCSSASSLFIFEVAFCFAKKGISPFIITNGPCEEIRRANRCLLYPEILRLITFRYLKSSREVIRWCHEIHYLRKKPIALLIALDHYSKSDNFEIVRICAALVDALNYVSVCYKSKEIYLLASATIKVDHLPQLHSFFCLSWLYSKTRSHVVLKPYNNNIEDKTSSHQIKISHNSCFEDIKKIFIHYSENV